MLQLALLAAATGGGDGTASTLVSGIFTNVITAGVIAAIITGAVQFFGNRRNARITERKNAVDTESDLVARYKDAAAEERAQKESAVKTIKELLAASEAQVASLKDTVLALNESIEALQRATTRQENIIRRLETERDRLDIARSEAERVHRAALAELEKAQITIQSFERKQRELDERANEVFGI